MDPINTPAPQGLVKPELKPRGIMQVVTNSELVQHEKDMAAYKDQTENPELVLDNLTSYVRKQWQAAYQARSSLDQRLLSCLRQRNGVYDPTKLNMIREQGGSEVFVMLTNIKCRAAESWIHDILFQPGEHPWNIDPTPIPDLPPHITDMIQQTVEQEAAMASQFAAMQGQPPIQPAEVMDRVQKLKAELEKRLEDEAQRRCDAMKTKIEDQLEQGGWEDAMREFIKDVTTYPIAILRGPVMRRKRTLTWKMQQGKWMPVIGSEIQVYFYRVSPFDFYPAPNARDTNCAYLFERHRLYRTDLAAMKGTPGVKDENVDKVLAEHGKNGLQQWLNIDSQRDELEGRPQSSLASEQTIDALEFSGKVSGAMLLDWGMTKKNIPDPSAEYEANLWLIGNYMIKAVLNDNLLDERNYHTACFEKVAGSIIGTALPEMMSDAQDICNAAARAIVNNAGMASGPMVDVSTDRLATGEEVEDVAPWRIYQTKSDPNGTNTPAIRFYQPSINVEPLLKIYEHFSRIADEHTGIPAYTYGTPQAGGAAGTASGLSMLMSSASRGIKLVIRSIDQPIEGSVEQTYYYNMQYDKDETIKGDLNVYARGSSSLIAKEQRQTRLKEMLAETNNPNDMGIIGPEGRATLLREAMKALDIVVDEVVPDDDQMRQRLAQQMQQQMAIEGRQPNGAPQTLDQAGNPAAGQDHALFQQGAA